MVKAGYKKTEIGLLPDSWEISKIGDFTDVFSGGTPNTKVKEFWGGDIPWMNSGELNGKHIYDVEGRITQLGLSSSSARMIPEQCVLIGLAGQGKTRGTAAINWIPLTTNQSIAAIYPSEKHDSLYLFYVMESKYKLLRDISSGDGTRGGLTKGLIKNVIVPLPLKEEQQRIAQTLRDIDALISNLELQVEKDRNLKQACLAHLFPRSGQTEPEIRLEGCSGEWGKVQFSELADTRRGLTYKPEDVTDSGVRVLRSSNIDEDIFTLRPDDVFVKRDSVNIDETTNGDILITAANGSNRLVGKHAIVNGLEGATVHGGFMVLASAQNPNFLNASMSSWWYAEFIKKYVAGGNGTIGNLNKSVLDRQEILAPKAKEMNKIGEFFSNIDKKTAHHRYKLKKYRALKQGMMEQLLTGKIRL